MQPNQTDKQFQTILNRILDKSETKSTVRFTDKVMYKASVEAYLEVASRGWSMSSQTSEAARLRKLVPLLEQYGFNAESIYNELYKTMSAYTMRTIFVRLKRLYDFCVKMELLPTGAANNPFEHYMTIVAPNKFKMANVYKPKEVGSNYTTVKAKIQSLVDADIRASLLFLLQTGLRVSELYKLQQDTLTGNWYVKGKGGKLRSVMFTPPEKIAGKWAMQKELVKLNLTFHALRKLAATQLANSGLTANDLQTVFGWSSINTAQSYLQKTSDEKLKQKLNEVL